MLRIGRSPEPASLEYTFPILQSGQQKENLGVLSTVHYGGPHWTVPELSFEKKQLIPEIQQLVVSYQF